MSSLTACLALAATLNSLAPAVITAIHAVERGGVGTVAHNRNGTEDLGPMQVNTLWIPTIAAATGESRTAVRVRLINDPCFNATIAGAILARFLDETHGDLWRAIGFYHTRLPLQAARYQLAVAVAAAEQ